MGNATSYLSIPLDAPSIMGVNLKVVACNDKPGSLALGNPTKATSE